MYESVLDHMELPVLHENLQAALKQANSIATNFILTPAIMFAIAVYVSFRYLTAWKLKNPGPSSNLVVLVSRVLLITSVFLSFLCINHFHASTLFNSFLFCSISCYLQSFSMFISYDFRNPPYQKFGLLLCSLGTILNVYSAFYIYDSEWSHVAHIPYILGLHVFVIGSTVLYMNLLKAVYETSEAETRES